MPWQRPDVDSPSVRTDELSNIADYVVGSASELQSAVSDASAGDTIFAGSGEYQLSSPLQWKDRLRIVGESVGFTMTDDDRFIDHPDQEVDVGGTVLVDDGAGDAIVGDSTDDPEFVNLGFRGFTNGLNLGSGEDVLEGGLARRLRFYNIGNAAVRWNNFLRVRMDDIMAKRVSKLFKFHNYTSPISQRNAVNCGNSFISRCGIYAGGPDQPNPPTNTGPIHVEADNGNWNMLCLQNIQTKRSDGKGSLYINGGFKNSSIYGFNPESGASGATYAIFQEGSGAYQRNDAQIQFGATNISIDGTSNRFFMPRANEPQIDLANSQNVHNWFYIKSFDTSKFNGPSGNWVWSRQPSPPTLYNGPEPIMDTDVGGYRIHGYQSGDVVSRGQILDYQDRSKSITTTSFFNDMIRGVGSVVWDDLVGGSNGYVKLNGNFQASNGETLTVQLYNQTDGEVAAEIIHTGSDPDFQDRSTGWVQYTPTTTSSVIKFVVRVKTDGGSSCEYAELIGKVGEGL